MNKLTTLSAACVSLLFVAACAGLMSAGPAYAQSVKPPQDVRVTNLPAQPVPVSIQNLPAVQVGNDNTNPVPVAPRETEIAYQNVFQVTSGFFSHSGPIEVGKYEKIRVVSELESGGGNTLVEVYTNSSADDRVFLEAMPSQGSSVFEVPGRTISLQIVPLGGSGVVRVTVYGR